jgi:hypothetical protein
MDSSGLRRQYLALFSTWCDTVKPGLAFVAIQLPFFPAEVSFTLTVDIKLTGLLN